MPDAADAFGQIDDYMGKLSEPPVRLKCFTCDDDAGIAPYRVTSRHTDEVAYICDGCMDAFGGREPVSPGPEPDINFVRQDLVALERELRT